MVYFRKATLGILAAAALTCAPAQAKTYDFIIHVPGIQPSTTPVASPVTYATLNPGDMGSTTVLSNGNLTDVSSLASGVRGTLGKSSGKWYYEMTVNSMENATFSPALGIATSTTPLSGGAWVSGPGEYIYYGTWNGELISGNNSRAAYGSNFYAGDVIGVAVDLDNHLVTFYRNGTSQGVAFSSLPTATYFPFVSDAGDSTYSSQETLNFGQNPFKYSVPSGYNAGWYQ